MSIGSRIKEARLALGYTQEQLGADIGATKGAIANYENEVSTPKLEYMYYRLFTALKCDANFLYQDDMKAPVESVVPSREPGAVRKIRSA